MNEFKLWDIKNKQMIEDCVFIDENGNLYKVSDDIQETPHTEIEQLDKSNFIVLEYTGFRDRHHNKIYRGDIVEWKTTIKELSTNETVLLEDVHHVEKHESGLWVMSTIENVLFGEHESVLVIGNIYQNPESLKRLRSNQ